MNPTLADDTNTITKRESEVAPGSAKQIGEQNTENNKKEGGEAVKKFSRTCWIITLPKKYKNDDKSQYSYSMKRFVDTFEKNGIQCNIIYSSDIDVFLTRDDRKSILVAHKIRKLPDFCLSRTGAKTDFYTLAVYRHLEKLGVPVINSSEAVVTVKDKLFTSQILGQKHIPIPKTFLLKHPVNTKYVVKVLGLPVIIKLLSGMQGKGVFIAHTREELKTYCDMLEAVSPSSQMIFQECITNSLGKDLRVLVVGGKVIGAMKRMNDQDFRANIHRGGTGSSYKLHPNAEYLALTTARILGLDIAGVDLLFDNLEETEFKVCEVNSSPGFEGFEKAVSIDVPSQILSYIRVACAIPPENIS